MKKPERKLKKSSIVAWAILLSSLTPLSSCSYFKKVKIHDEEFCGDKGRLGAKCFKTLSGEERSIPKEQWDQERFGQICSSAETFANWTASIQKLCKLSGRCSYDAKKKLIMFHDNVESFRTDINEMGAFPLKDDL